MRQSTGLRLNRSGRMLEPTLPLKGCVTSGKTFSEPRLPHLQNEEDWERFHVPSVAPCAETVSSEHTSPISTRVVHASPSCSLLCLLSLCSAPPSCQAQLSLVPLPQEVSPFPPAPVGPWPSNQHLSHCVNCVLVAPGLLYKFPHVSVLSPSCSLCSSGQDKVLLFLHALAYCNEDSRLLTQTCWIKESLKTEKMIDQDFL